MLCPNPSYPIHAFGFLMAGGVIRSVPAEPTQDYFHALERAVIHSIPKPLAVVVCYPSNPTAHVAISISTGIWSRSRRSTASSSCRTSPTRRSISTTSPPPSVLEVPGAMDVTVEFTSMSKTFSMPGWRMGFAVGNERIIAALARVKSYLDYGAFTPIQVAAAAALNGPEDCITEMRETYKTPPRCAGRQLRAAPAGQCRRRPPRCSPGRRIPEPFREMGSLEFSKLLVEKAEVAVSPGVGFGEHGEGYVRIALVENEQRIRQAARNIRRFLDTGLEKLHNVVPLADPALSRSRLRILGRRHGCAAESGSRRSRHGRCIGGAPDRAAAHGPDRALRPPDRNRGGHARAAAKNRGVDLKKFRWVADPVALARDPGIDVFVELMGGDGDPAKSRGRGRAQGRQACRDREQGAAREAWCEARGARRAQSASR